MTEAEVVEAAMSEKPPEVPEKVTVAWDDFLKACAERGIEFVEGKTVLQMKEDFLGNLDDVIPDSEEENSLSDLVVDIQIALVDKAEIIGSPEDANPKGVKKTKVKKEKIQKEKVVKEPKPKKVKVPKESFSKLGGIGMKPMCRNLFGDMNRDQVKAAEVAIKEELAQVYVKAGLGDHKYGMVRAHRIFCDICVESFGESLTPKRVTVPKEEKVKKEKKAPQPEAIAPEPEADPVPSPEEGSE